MALTTNDEVLARLGHPTATNSTLTANITDAIAAATTAIYNMTGRTFVKSTADETRVLAPTTPRLLRVPDLVSVTTLKTDSANDGLFATTITDYELDTYHTSQTGWPYEIIRTFTDVLPMSNYRRLTVQVVGIFGWAAVPAPINFAASLLASRLALRGSTALYGVQSFGDLGAASIRNSDPDVAAMLEPYRIHGVA